jgi:lauroyl/myristoyl acyltransferase
LSIALFGFKRLKQLCQNLNPSKAKKKIDFLAQLYYRLDWKKKNNVHANLNALLGEKADPSLGPEVYRHFGYFLFEFFSEHPQTFIDQNQLKKSCFELLGEPGAKANLMLTSHSANWESNLRFFLNLGYRVTTVAQAHSHPDIDRFFGELRDHPNLHCSGLNTGLSACRHALQNQEIVALACERDLLGTGLPFQWKQHSLSLPLGPSWLIKRFGPDTFFVHSKRIQLGAFSTQISPINTSDCDGDLKEITKKWGQMLLENIEASPEQWLNFEPLFSAISTTE